MIRVIVQKDGVGIKGLTAEEVAVLMYVLHGVDERCYHEKNDDGNFDSGDDYLGQLTESERESLRSLARGLKVAFNRF